VSFKRSRDNDTKKYKWDSSWTVHSTTQNIVSCPPIPLFSSEDPELRKLMHKTIPDDPQLEPRIPFDVGTMSFAGELSDSQIASWSKESLACHKREC